MLDTDRVRDVQTSRLPNPMFPLEDGCVGMPMPATVLGVFDKNLNELNYGEAGELCMTGPSMMLHYSGWRGEEMTEKTLIEHADGNTWLHTGDEAYITEQGIIHILGRGAIRAYGDKPLRVMRMETKAVRTPGVQDGSSALCRIWNMKDISVRICLSFSMEPEPWRKWQNF